MKRRPEGDYDLDSIEVITAEVGEDFQEYEDEEGRPLEAGELVGVELQRKDGEWEMILFAGVRFKN